MKQQQNKQQQDKQQHGNKKPATIKEAATLTFRFRYGTIKLAELTELIESATRQATKQPHGTSKPKTNKEEPGKKHKGQRSTKKH